MNIETERFGTLELSPDEIITFPDGVPGFEGFRQYTIVAHQSPLRSSASPFQWIQSTEKPELAFLAVDPRHFFPEYEASVSRTDLESVGSVTLSSIQVLVLLTVPPNDPRGITANLLAPIIMNKINRCAKQIIINSDKYGLRHRLVAETYAQTASVSCVPHSKTSRSDEASSVSRERLPA